MAEAYGMPLIENAEILRGKPKKDGVRLERACRYDSNKPAFV